MLMDIHDAFNTPSMLKDLRVDPVLSDVIPNDSQLFASAEPIPIRAHIHRSVPVVSTTYPESAYLWLVEVLEGLIDFGNQHGHYGVINLTEDEYEWLDNVLEELVYSVGDNENHLLTPLMELVIRLINDYEDTYVPKLTEQSPKLAEKETFETGTEDDLAAYAFFSIGFLLYQGKMTEKALSAYSNAIALFNLDQHDRAKDDFNKAIELDTKFVDAYYNRGVMNLESGNYLEAFADFNKAIALNPNFLEAYYNRGVTFQKLGKHEEAIVDLDKTIELSPDSAEFYFTRGCVKGSSGQHESAIADFDIAIGLDPNFFKAYAVRGYAKKRLGRNESALVDFDEAIELGIETYEIFYFRATTKNELGQHELAILDFDRAIELKSDFTEAYNLRGFSKDKLGQQEEALADYSEAIRIKPDFTEVYARRAAIMADLGNVEEARNNLQTALELAEQQGQQELKIFIEEKLQELNNLAP